MKIVNLLTNNIFSCTCFFIGIIWFLMLSQFELNQKTYMSENALLVGLIKQQFSNRSAINYFYNEILSLTSKGNSEMTKSWLKETLENIGLDAGFHNFTFKYNKLLKHQKFDGQNVYGILRSPGAARMQSILITCPLRYGSDDVLENQPLISGISMILALAQHARNKLFWATDIIFLFTEMEYIGLKAYLNAYHGLIDSQDYIEYHELLHRSGSILAGFNVEIASSKIPYLEFRLESLNGQLPNLDLYNTLVRLAQSTDIPIRIHGIPPPISNSLKSRQNGLRSFLAMMWHQASGSPTGLHGLLADFQIPSLTLFSPVKSRNSARTNLFDVTRLMESTLRSLNGLQERMHQSFFFYLLPTPMSYVSIGIYMMPFGLCISGLLFQVFGAMHYFRTAMKQADADKEQEKVALDWWNLGILIITALGVGFFTNICLDHFMTLSHNFNIEPSSCLLFGSVSILVALVTFCRLKISSSTHHSVILLKAALQLLVGLFLGTLSVLNISMAFFCSIVAVPGALLVYPYRNRPARLLLKTYLIAIFPLTLVYAAALIHGCYFPVDPPSVIANMWNGLEKYQVAFETTRNWLIQAWLERDVLGSWTANIFTLCYLPVWTGMWLISCIPAPA